MADNLTLNAGSGGAILATDEIADAHYQKVKLAFGAADAATLVSGTDGLPVNVLNASIAVTGAFWQATQPVSAAALPLPAGAATSALQSDGNASLVAIANSLTGTVAVSAAALPLPTGAATAANQATANGYLQTLAGSVAGGHAQVDVLTMPAVAITAAALPLPTGAATQATLASVLAQLDITLSALRDAITGSGAAAKTLGDVVTALAGIEVTNDTGNPLPVNGTITANIGSGNLAGIASNVTVVGTGTFTVQAAQSGVWSARLQDGAGNALASSTTNPAGTEQALIVRTIVGAGTQPVSGTVAATQSGTWNIGTVTGITNPVAVTAASLPLPTGAATAAKQPALGTAGTPAADVISVQGVVGGAAVPVSLASVPSHAVTVTGDALTALQLIDNAVSGDGFNVTQLAGAAVPIGAGTEAAALRVTLATDSTGVVSIDDGGGVITVDGTVTANAGTNLNTSALALESGGNLAGAATSLAIVDDWDSSDDCRSIQQSAAAMDGATRCDVKRFRVKCGNGANTLIAAVANKKFRLRSLAILATSGTAVTVYLSTTTDTGVLGDSTDKLTFDLDGGSGPAGVVLPYNPDGWLQTSTANEALTATLSAAEEVWIIGTYLEVA